MKFITFAISFLFVVTTGIIAQTTAFVGVNVIPMDRERGTNTQRRAGVMLKGKWYTQTELDRWLDEIAPKIASSHIEPKQ